MVTPVTSPARREKVAQLCTGFIYTVALLGVTGVREQLSENIVPLVEALKKQTEVPICVGFGVSKPEQARALAQAGADGVIVGSAVVDIVEKNLASPDRGRAELHEFIRGMKESL